MQKNLLYILIYPIFALAKQRKSWKAALKNK